VAGGRALRCAFAFITGSPWCSLTPVVTFYLPARALEEADRRLDEALPLDHGRTIRKLARESNAAIEGTFRGQALVCIERASIYASACQAGSE